MRSQHPVNSETAVQGVGPKHGLAAGASAGLNWLRARMLARPDLWLVLLLIIPAMLPLAAPGYFFDAHDARHSVFWVVEFDQAVRDGALWPIWAPDHALGFGYPLWVVYAPLAYAAAELFHLLGLGFTAAVKVTWALSFVAGAAGMYGLARRWWGRSAALIAALAYTYAPYHLVQIYVRGALAEFAALAIFPWTWLAFAALWDDPRPRRAAWAALALGLLVLSHSAAPIMFLPLLGGYLLLKAAFLVRRPDAREPSRGQWTWRARARPVACTGAALALGLVLAGIFLLPLFLERQYVGQELWLRNTYDYRLHFVYPGQLFSPAWGFGHSVPGPGDGMSFQLGLMPFLGAVIAVLAAVATALRRWSHGQQTDLEGTPASRALPALAEAFFLGAVSLVAIFAMMPAARPIWDTLPLISLLQFPWRLLAVTVVTLALLAAAGVAWLEAAGPARGSESASGRAGTAQDTVPATSHGPFVYAAALAIVLASLPYTRPELVPVRPEDESPLAVIEFEMHYPDMRGMTSWSERQPVDADSPLLPQYLAGQPLTRAAIVSGTGTILEQGHAANSASVRLRAEGPVHLRFYTYYFPGWRATVNGQPALLQQDPPNGLIGLDLPAGEHVISLRFGATPVRRVGTALSVAGLVTVGLLLIAGRRRSPDPG